MALSITHNEICIKCLSKVFSSFPLSFSTTGNHYDGEKLTLNAKILIGEKYSELGYPYCLASSPSGLPCPFSLEHSLLESLSVW
jgi:hypothetical protein